MCFGERKTPVNCITLFSIVVFICSIIMYIFAYLGTQGETMEKIKEAESMDDLNTVSQVMAVFFFGLATLILVLSILGFLFRCCTHPCYAWIYGTCLFPVWLILLIFGGVAVAWATASEDDLVKYCGDLQTEVQKQNEEKSSVKYDLNIYDQIRIDEYMCRQDTCPCDISGADLGWNQKSQKELDDTYDAQNREAGTFYFKENGYMNYDACIKGAKDGEVDADFFAFAKGFREQDDFADIEDYIKFFEDEYACAGICTPALFYMQLDLTKGVPEGSCLLSIQDELKTSLLGVGGAAFASGIFLFFTFIFQYCLWRKYDE